MKAIFKWEDWFQKVYFDEKQDVFILMKHLQNMLNDKQVAI
jgi:hypothetical protein